jgi:uncharacterized lipoprotein YajG
MKNITINDLNNKIKQVVTRREFTTFKRDMKQEFTHVHKEMATKEELRQLEQEVRNVEIDLTAVKQAVLETRGIMVTKDDWRELMVKIDRLFDVTETLMQEKTITDKQIERIEKDVAFLKE